MKSHGLILAYACALLTSAALLFVVQPVFSKMILPLLGGTSQVWTTAMLFFQILLLAGYIYAHLISKYAPFYLQALMQVALLGSFFLFLPFEIPENTIPPVDANPTFWQLQLMFLVIGGPFFILSTSAPLLQKWFSYSDHKDASNPYFLYGASNLGSMASLVAYPFLIEPVFPLAEQSNLWMIGYAALICLTVFSAITVMSSPQSKEQKDLTRQNISAIPWVRRGYWLLLAFLPSSLMLGVTTHITTDIASVPLLWIMPLALYVGTFIIVFSRREIIKINHIHLLQGLSLVMLIAVTIAYNQLNPFLFLGLHLSVFFFSALSCHKQLSDARPSADHLTEFYMIMSIGGALGGIFNALIAPIIFLLPLEYTLILCVITYLRYKDDSQKSLTSLVGAITLPFKTKSLDSIFNIQFLGFISILGIMAHALYLGTIITNLTITTILIILGCIIINSRWALLLSLCCTMILFTPGYRWSSNEINNLRYLDRNFFGVLRVIDTPGSERTLMHGTTNHGSQPLSELHRLKPLSYYSKHSPVKDTIAYLDQFNKNQRIAVAGLGIGVLSCFAKENRHYDFFEIDPAVAEIAQNKELFTYLSDCGSTYDIILGDARLTIANQTNELYDLIIIDVFSSDNIPAHLITREAISLYLQKLKPDGILTFHISNNHLDLEPVLAASGAMLEVTNLGKVSDSHEIEGTDLISYPSHYFLFLKDEKQKQFFIDRQWSEGIIVPHIKSWSDDYSNIISVIGQSAANERYTRQFKKEE